MNQIVHLNIQMIISHFLNHNKYKIINIITRIIIINKVKIDIHNLPKIVQSKILINEVFYKLQDKMISD